MEIESDKAFNELMQEVQQQQQFLWYQEKSSRRFHELKELIELAVQNIEILKKKKAQKRGAEKFVNPFAKTQFSGNESLESLHHLKLKFPRFEEGGTVAEWLQDCEQYFAIYKIGESRKVAIAGMHLEGVARRWFQIYTVERNNLEWTDFCKHIAARFGVWEQELLYDKFKHLQQTSTVELYFAQFEKYMEQLKEKMPLLTKEYFVFISGLQDKTKETLRLLGPVTLEQAYVQSLEKW